MPGGGCGTLFRTSLGSSCLPAPPAVSMRSTTRSMHFTISSGYTPCAPSTRKSATVLWETVSGQCPAPKTIRSLEILTGGSPRLLTIVARFGAGRSFRELMADLLNLVDDHTEYAVKSQCIGKIAPATVLRRVSYRCCLRIYGSQRPQGKSPIDPGWKQASAAPAAYAPHRTGRRSA